MGDINSLPIFRVLSNNEEGNHDLEERETKFINQLFINNGFDPLMTPEQYYKNKTKHSKSYSFPMSIQSKEFKLEKDYLSIMNFYLTFKYSSKYDFDIMIFLNAEEDFSHFFSNNDFYPSTFFLNKIISINNISKGINIEFLEKNCSLNLEEFYENKLYDKDYNDLVIECFLKNGKYKLVYYCKIIFYNNEKYIIKPKLSKICIKNNWFISQSVFGLDEKKDENLCEACLTNQKNTIFLPCMHSYTCEDCSLSVRLAGNKCPLCREKIKETILIDNFNKSSQEKEDAKKEGKKDEQKEINEEKQIMNKEKNIIKDEKNI